MAIKEINLLGDVQAHINNRTKVDIFKAAVVNPAEDLITKTIKGRTSNEYQITGDPMPELKSSYAAKKSSRTQSAKPDLRYGYNRSGKPKAKAMDSLYSKVKTSKDEFDINYDFAASADDGSLSATEYMGIHQTGKKGVTLGSLSNGKRKWFPADDISTEAGVVVLTKEIEKIISAHMNKGAISRTIVIGQK